MHKINELARKYNVAILLVAHYKLNKAFGVLKVEHIEIRKPIGGDMDSRRGALTNRIMDNNRKRFWKRIKQLLCCNRKNWFSKRRRRRNKKNGFSR